MTTTRLLLIPLSLLALAITSCMPEAEGNISTGSVDSNTSSHPDFDFDQVKVIFEENCLDCHGAERQKGKFRMDTLAGLLEGGSSGPALVKGNAEESLLYELIVLHADDDDRMPSDDDPLTEEQQSLVKNWIEAGAPWEGTLVAREKPKQDTIELTESPFSGLASVDLQDSANQALASEYVDTLIDQDLQAKGEQPGAIVFDETFLKRAYLDITGRIPTLNEYERFFATEAPDKRIALIDELLNSAGYVSASHNYWMDALRAKFRVGKNTFGPYINWIAQSIKQNMPYDQFAYELVASEGRISDPENGAVGYYLRDDSVGFMAEDSLSNTMQLFLATDILCAQCHDHPYKKWTQRDFYELMAFTNGTLVRGTALNRRGEMGYQYMLDILKPTSTPQKNGFKGYYKSLQRGAYKGGTGTAQLPPDYKYDDGEPNQIINAKVPFGDPVEIDYDNPNPNTDYHFIDHVRKDPRPDVRSRMHFAKWITSPENPMFTKTIVNRLWGRVFGSTLIGNNLDMKESDMGENPKLTAFLIDVMKRAKYDQKVFMKILYQTQSYQRTALEPVPETYYHPAPIVKRLTAEQIWDSLLAIRQKDPDRYVMDGTLAAENAVFFEMDRMSQAERVEFIRNGNSAKKEAYKNYDVIPSFPLATKSHRASLMRFDKVSGSFLDIYGKSERGLIDGSVQEATIPQALHLMNDSLYMATRKNGRSTSFLYDRLKKDSKKPAEVKIKHIYNTVLTRDPTPSEVQMATTSLTTDQGFDQDTLAWALTNSHEFKIKK